MLQRQTDLPAHVVQFARYLRENDFEIGPSEELDVLKTFLEKIPSSFASQEALFKALFVKNRQHFLRFDDLYQTYWKQLSRAEDSKTKTDKKNTQKSKRSAPSINTLKQWLYGGRMSETEEIAAYSAFEALAQKDFSQFALEERHELRALIRLIAKRMANKNNRRFVASRKRHKIDIKNTIKTSLSHRGEINAFKFHERKKKKVTILLICDVSKSMALYSKFLIEFMYHFQQVNQSLKTFVFSTQLSSLTRLLKDGDFDRVLDNLGSEVPQWSGGTRIGQSLHQLIVGHSQLLRKDTVVMILSDGWDTGDLGLLKKSMHHIYKKSERTIWLNPLAGNKNYSPSTQGMQTCLPFVDLFLPLFNIQSLKALAQKV